MFQLQALGSVALLAGQAYGVLMNNGLAATPQMGWDNWNAFGCDVSEDLLLGTAARMVELGLRDAGYYYVILDDCWSNGRYDNGSLRPNFEKFPNGMAHVADELHAMGMGFGMYSSAGEYTCGQYAGSLGYETIDAQTWASWGVDYLKYDNCYNDGQSGTPLISYTRYETMSRALNATGRQILYSLCNWGEDSPWNWAFTIANSYRISGDIYDNFDRPDVRCPCAGDQGYSCTLPGNHCSLMNIINKQAAFPERSQPGCWADLEMIEVGNGGMTDDEYKTHMTMWAANKSPLIMGTDVRILSAASLSIYMNPAILALSQDPTGNSAVRIWRYYVPETDANGAGEISLWAGSLAQGQYVVILLNAADQEMYMNATLSDIFLYSGYATSSNAQQSWEMYDLWANRMPNATANQILSANSTVGAMNVTNYYYNATQTSYKDGIMANNTVLMGSPVGTVQAMGTIATMVPRHGVAAYRLKPVPTAAMKKRYEL